MVFKNYVLIAWRGLLKHKGYALINILGLALGLACALLILCYTWNEWQVDRHHPHADRIYRILGEEQAEGRTTFQPGVVGGLGPALQTDFPEIERAVRVINPPYLTTWVYHEDRGFQQQFCVADAAILEVFDLPLIVGDPATALARPNAVVLTETTARRYFGEADPLGQVVRAEGFWGGDYVVTGIMADLPATTTLRFDLLSGHPPDLFDGWETSDWQPVEVYLRLARGARSQALEQKMEGWITQYMDAEAAARLTYHLQPLTRLYLYSAADYGLDGYGDITLVRLLAVIGGFILLIALINYMNLATARSTQRAKEVGVRKVVGATRRQLIGQFLGEAVLLSSLALVLGLGLAQAALPTLSQFTGKPLSLIGGHAGLTALVLIGAALLAGLLAGSYPACMLSAYQPAAVLKGTAQGGAGGARLRTLLVVFQFGVTAVLLVGTTIVYQQWRHLTSRHWGFNKDQVAVLPLIAVDPAPMWSENWLGWRLEAIKQAFLQHPNVLAASVSHVNPPLSIPTHLRAEGEAEARPMHYIYADKDFLETYEIDLLAGRPFDRDLLSDPDLFDILLNETAVRQLGWDDPIGKQVVWQSTGYTLTVVGVISDFLNQDLSRPIQPLFLTQAAQPPQLLSLRLRMEDLPETLAFLEATWQQFVPTRPFQFEFADATLQRMYRDDVRLGQLIGAFALLAIVIACLGLFGLAAYTAERRLREIGIRKVLGASVFNLTHLLSGGLVRLVLLANVVAWPLAYAAGTRWLQTFAYRIDVGILPFLFTGLLTVLIALCTVSYQAVKAALANPVDILRSE